MGRYVWSLVFGVLCWSSSGQLTPGTELVFSSQSTYYVSTAGSIGSYSTNGVTCFQDIGDSSKGKCVAISRESSGLISFGAVLTIDSVAILNYISVAVLSETYALVCYKNNGDSGAGQLSPATPQPVSSMCRHLQHPHPLREHTHCGHRDRLQPERRFQ